MREVLAEVSAGPVARRRWPWAVTAVVMAGLLLSGAALRFVGLNWDQYQQVHPDERFIVWVAETTHWPADLGTLLEPGTSPLNPFRWPEGSGDLAGQPRNYTYGHFPLYLLVVVAHGGQAVSQLLAGWGLHLPAALLHLTDYNNLALAGRAISAPCDLGTVVLVFLLARRTYGGEGREGERIPQGQREARGQAHAGGDWWPRRGVIAGGVAAGAYTLAALPAQLSHYATVDVTLTFAVVATVLLAVRGAQTGQFWAWPAAGALAGLAVGSKFSAAVIFAPLVMSALFALPGRDDPVGPERTLVRRLVATFLAAALVFVLTNPFAVLDGQAFLRNLAAQNWMVTGAMDAPYTRQYAGTAPYWYYVQQLSQWGLGWPLGLAAWGGFIWAVVRAGLRRAQPAEVVLLAWAVPYFGIVGAFYAKFIRYMAPLLPFLLVFAAGALLAAGYRFHARWGRRGAIMATAAAGAIFLFTAGWALAFSGVYRQEHPWIQASSWIYRNVPAGSKLLAEQWDDALPLALDEVPTRPPKRAYNVVELPLFEADNSAKLDGLVAELSSADYIVLSSNRLSRPIQNLPGRYPMSSQHYRLLFSGGLGYTEVADFSAYPRLGAWVVPDDNADESFTVYDHPHPRIFANTGRLSPRLLRARLGRYLPPGTEQSAPGDAAGPITSAESSTDPGSRRSRFQRDIGLVIHEGSAGAQIRPTQPVAATGKAPGHASLIRYDALPAAAASSASASLTAPDPQRPTPNPQRWNRFASEWPPAGAIVWWLAISLFGWLAFPLIFPLLGGLRDRGYGLARLVGWLLVGWVHWLGVSLGLWQNTVGALAVLLALLLLAGLAAAARQRGALAAFWSQHRRLILIEEALFAVVFLAFAGLRLLNPDLWQPWNGGEKFMEFAFLNATLRSAHFPPYDPYFAHGFINYYYYGLYLVGLPIKLTGLFPEVAFNLAIPGLFALAALAAFSVGASLAPQPRASVRTGLLAVLLALLMANLAGLEQLQNRLAEVGRTAGGTGGAGLLAMRGIGALLRGDMWPGYDYWAVSRVIPFTINEFPFWSFLFADLHPHLIAMPVGIAVAGLALNWVLPAWRPGEQDEAGAEWQTAAAVDAGTKPVAMSVNGPHPAGTPATSVEEALLPGAGSGQTDVDQLAEAEGLAAAGQPRAIAEDTASTSPAPAAPPASSDQVAAPAEDGSRGVLVRVLGSQVSWPVVAGRLALLALMLGALGPTNTWDLPVYFLLVAGAFWLAAWRAPRRAAVLEALLLAGLTGVLAVLAYLPFYQHYSAQVGGQSGSIFSRYLGLVQTSSPLQPWLKVWAIFLFLAYSFVLLAFWRRPGSVLEQPEDAAAGENKPHGTDDEWLQEPDGREQTGVAPSSAASPSAARPSATLSGRVILFLALIGVAMVLAMAGRPTVALTVVPFGLAFALAFDRFSSPHLAFVAFLIALSMAILAGSELIYLRDFLEGGDWYRMNTVFKFGIPAWLLLGLAGSVILPAVWVRLSRAGGWLGSLWQAAAALLIAAGLAFLFFGSQARVDDRFPGPRPPIGTLDGTAYMTVGRYSWPSDRHVIDLSYDYLAIHWMLDHVSGAPVVAEAPAGSYDVDGEQAGYDYYRAGGLRVASLTGFPTFVGQHQYEQRSAEQVGVRTELGQEFFETTDLARTRELISSLGVDYIYIGQLERLLFPAASLDKFAGMAQAGELETVYTNPQVAIYRVVK